MKKYNVCMVGIGAVGTLHGLLCGSDFRYRRGLCECRCHRSAAKQQSANRYTQEVVELCEATIHWGTVAFRGMRGHCRKPATHMQWFVANVGEHRTWISATS